MENRKNIIIIFITLTIFLILSIFQVYRTKKNNDLQKDKTIEYNNYTFNLDSTFNYSFATNDYNKKGLVINSMDGRWSATIYIYENPAVDIYEKSTSIVNMLNDIGYDASNPKYIEIVGKKVLTVENIDVDGAGIIAYIKTDENDLYEAIIRSNPNEICYDVLPEIVAILNTGKKTS